MLASIGVFALPLALALLRRIVIVAKLGSVAAYCATLVWLLDYTDYAAGECIWGLPAVATVALHTVHDWGMHIA